MEVALVLYQAEVMPWPRRIIRCIQRKGKKAQIFLRFFSIKSLQGLFELAGKQQHGECDGNGVGKGSAIYTAMVGLAEK